MPGHIRRLLLILALAAIAGASAKYYLTDPSFGHYGHYRADSVPEIAAQQPRYQGPESCRQCHQDRVAFWQRGTHRYVKCELCHGPAARHPTNKAMHIPDNTITLCGSCHESLPARPNQVIRQIKLSEHMNGQACIECHNPHSPSHFTWEDIDESQMVEAGDG